MSVKPIIITAPIKIVVSALFILSLLLWNCSPTTSDNPNNNNTTPLDTVKPVITLSGADTVTIMVNKPYTEQGATAIDNLEGDISSRIQIISAIDTTKPGVYPVIYFASDKAGNVANKQRSVIVATVFDTIRPVIKLNGADTVKIMVNKPYTEPGATVTDNIDGDISFKIQIIRTVDTARPGVYSVIYFVSDRAGNVASKTRNVVVTAKNLEILQPWPYQELAGLNYENIVVRHDLRTVPFIATDDCMYSADNGTSWGKMKDIIAVKGAGRMLDTNYSFSVFQWKPEGDSLAGKTVYIKVQGYGAPNVYDVVGPLTIF